MRAHGCTRTRNSPYGTCVTVCMDGDGRRVNNKKGIRFGNLEWMSWAICFFMMPHAVLGTTLNWCVCRCISRTLMKITARSSVKKLVYCRRPHKLIESIVTNNNNTWIAYPMFESSTLAAECPHPTHVRCCGCHQIQMCADLCEDSKYFGTQYANEVWPPTSPKMLRRYGRTLYRRNTENGRMFA